MDDGLRSGPTAQQALQFIKDSQAIFLPLLFQFSVFSFFQGPKILIHLTTKLSTLDPFLPLKKMLKIKLLSKCE